MSGEKNRGFFSRFFSRNSNVPETQTEPEALSQEIRLAGADQEESKVKEFENQLNVEKINILIEQAFYVLKKGLMGVSSYDELSGIIEVTNQAKAWPIPEFKRDFPEHFPDRIQHSPASIPDELKSSYLTILQGELTYGNLSSDILKLWVTFYRVVSNLTDRINALHPDKQDVLKKSFEREIDKLLLFLEERKTAFWALQGIRDAYQSTADEVARDLLHSDSRPMESYIWKDVVSRRVFGVTDGGIQALRESYPDQDQLLNYAETLVRDDTDSVEDILQSLWFGRFHEMLQDHYPSDFLEACDRYSQIMREKSEAKKKKNEPLQSEAKKTLSNKPSRFFIDVFAFDLNKVYTLPDGSQWYWGEFERLETNSDGTQTKKKEQVLLPAPDGKVPKYSHNPTLNLFYVDALVRVSLQEVAPQVKHAVQDLATIDAIVKIMRFSGSQSAEKMSEWLKSEHDWYIEWRGSSSSPLKKVMESSRPRNWWKLDLNPNTLKQKLRMEQAPLQATDEATKWMQEVFGAAEQQKETYASDMRALNYFYLQSLIYESVQPRGTFVPEWDDDQIEEWDEYKNRKKQWMGIFRQLTQASSASSEDVIAQNEMYNQVLALAARR